jgi:hypothetical protein
MENRVIDMCFNIQAYLRIRAKDLTRQSFNRIAKRAR